MNVKEKIKTTTKTTAYSYHYYQTIKSAFYVIHVQKKTKQNTKFTMFYPYKTIKNRKILFRIKLIGTLNKTSMLHFKH